MNGFDDEHVYMGINYGDSYNAPIYGSNVGGVGNTNIINNGPDYAHQDHIYGPQGSYGTPDWNSQQNTVLSRREQELAAHLDEIRKQVATKRAQKRAAEIAADSAEFDTRGRGPSDAHRHLPEIRTNSDTTRVQERVNILAAEVAAAEVEFGTDLNGLPDELPSSEVCSIQNVDIQSLRPP